MKLLKPPQPLDITGSNNILFLGGSIEMGTATKWQDRFIEELSDQDVLILNPRRDDWDSSWEQDPTPGTPFYEQVKWELDGQDLSNLLIYYFDPNTKSPITLLELGLYAHAWKHVYVYCPKEFWRYGNVKMVCDKYGISVYDDESYIIQVIKESIKPV